MRRQESKIVGEKPLRRVVALGSIALTTLLLGASPSAARLTGIGGDVQTLHHAPTDVSPEALTSDDHVFVFSERRCEALAADLPVDAFMPSGTYGESATQPGAVPAGTQVDSPTTCTWTSSGRPEQRPRPAL